MSLSSQEMIYYGSDSDSLDRPSLVAMSSVSSGSFGVSSANSSIGEYERQIKLEAKARRQKERQHDNFCKDMWVSPRKDAATNEHFFLFEYKTARCPMPSACPNRQTCACYHDELSRRRPVSMKYSRRPCGSVKVSGHWQSPSRCPKGDSCKFAHTLLEQMYHPSVYKSKVCTHHVAGSRKCYYGFYCTHVHKGEVFTTSSDSEPKVSAPSKRDSLPNLPESPESSPAPVSGKFSPLSEYEQPLPASLEPIPSQSELWSFCDNGSQYAGGYFPSYQYQTYAHAPATYYYSDAAMMMSAPPQPTVVETTEPAAMDFYLGAF